MGVGRIGYVDAGRILVGSRAGIESEVGVLLQIVAELRALLHDTINK